MAALCEHHHAIDLAQLRRLKPGWSRSINWSWGGRLTGSISIHAGQHYMGVAYRYEQPGRGTWREVQQTLHFTETETPFGGRRRWFECPSCLRPCRVLYGAGRFLCRLCLRLRYASQNENAGGRVRNRAQKLRMRLGGSGNLLEPFPPRPKHMQWRRYWRLKAMDARLLGRSTAELARVVEAMRRRL